ncbi:MAG: aminodeoxychorismate synthase component I [Planctomycetota bacterium]
MSTVSKQHAERRPGHFSVGSEKTFPLVRPLPEEFTPEYCFRRLAKLDCPVWLDSSLQHEHYGRFSYLAADPFAKVRIDKPTPDALVRFAELSSACRQEPLDDLPPFQGGWLGWFGYELGHCFEDVPEAANNEFHLPLANLGLYDVVLSWDHQEGRGYIVSQGFPYQQTDRRMNRAYRRLKWMSNVLGGPEDFEARTASTAMAEHRLAEQFSTRWSEDWTSNFSSAMYRDAVARCVEYVYAGDIFQVNLSQRLLTKARAFSPELYLHLRQQNPAPFSGYADFGRTQVISSSPERFLQLRNGELEARPIKGTRPRLTDPLADHGIAELLQASAKDVSENVMIVDLLRNDLSRVSHEDSVRVEQLCGLEKYPYVWHLVSVIRSRLNSDATPWDVLRGTFPGGSITGAPKIRAMEIVAELEPTARGPYCGSLGYISFAGDMDLSILIRTVTACEGWWQVPVGGGIVADSDPALEEQETWHKAEGILRAIDGLPSSSKNK